MAETGEKRKPGRPCKSSAGKLIPQGLALPQEVRATLLAHAKERGTSMSTIAGEALTTWIREERRRRPEDSE
jgi:hypothetical protein